MAGWLLTKWFTDSLKSCRTTFISLIYLRDHSALEEYINLMLRDQVAAAISRGLHRLYYGDPEA
jgi:hypothetical protein